MENIPFMEKAVEWAEKQRFDMVKANFENYESPTPYTRTDGGDPFIPDITGMQLGKKVYVEIATKTDNVRRKVSKWKLLSTLVSMKGGKLFLLAPKGHKAFTEDIVKKHNLNARVIYLR